MIGEKTTSNEVSTVPEVQSFPELLASANMEAWITQLRVSPDQPSIGELLDQPFDANPKVTSELRTHRLAVAQELVASLIDTHNILTTLAPSEVQMWWQSAPVAEIEAKLSPIKAEIYELLVLIFPGSVESVILKLDGETAKAQNKNNIEPAA